MCHKFMDFTKSFEVHTDQNDFAIDGCSNKMDTQLLSRVKSSMEHNYND
jgi:hypothetical protein